MHALMDGRDEHPRSSCRPRPAWRRGTRSSGSCRTSARWSDAPDEANRGANAARRGVGCTPWNACPSSRRAVARLLSSLALVSLAVWPAAARARSEAAAATPRPSSRTPWPSSSPRTSRRSATSPAPPRRTRSSSRSTSPRRSAKGRVSTASRSSTRMSIDTSKVTVGEPTINGDTATVPVTGSMKMSVDTAQDEADREGRSSRRQGLPADDAAVDAMMGVVGGFTGQDDPDGRDHDAGQGGRGLEDLRVTSTGLLGRRTAPASSRTDVRGSFRPNTCSISRRSGRLGACPRIGSSCAARASTTSRTSTSRSRATGWSSSPACPAAASPASPSTPSTPRASGGTSRACRAYARQFLGQMEKPDVDQIDGLSPAISIDQKGASRATRGRRSAR